MVVVADRKENVVVSICNARLALARKLVAVLLFTSGCLCALVGHLFFGSSLDLLANIDRCVTAACCTCLDFK